MAEQLVLRGDREGMEAAVAVAYKNYGLFVELGPWTRTQGERLATVRPVRYEPAYHLRVARLIQDLPHEAGVRAWRTDG